MFTPIARRPLQARGGRLVLALGWSFLEGVGAALVLPALAALIAGNYEGKDRAVAYSVIGGVAGAGIAVGPILGLLDGDDALAFVSRRWAAGRDDRGEGEEEGCAGGACGSQQDLRGFETVRSGLGPVTGASSSSPRTG